MPVLRLRSIALASVLSLPVAAWAQPTPAAGAGPIQAAAPVVPPHGAPQSFADLAQALLPAVVNISSTESLPAGQGPDGIAPGSPFEKFFHDFMNRQHPGGPQNQAPEPGQPQPQAAPGGGDQGAQGGDQAAPPRELQSLGSGFVVDPSGIIVTNNHVIDGAQTITVTLQDNTVLKAKLLGADKRTDLAVLKVEPAGKLPYVAFGNSAASRVGDWVMAIGNPFGLGGTVTAGIISARGRDIQEGPYDDFIQTDAPINRGNSGGPLFDMQGRVVGINTAIYSPSGGSIGIGFAIPSDEARVVVDQIIRYGHAERGWLGVRVQQVTPDLARALGLSPPAGAMVAGIDPKGPAAAAHLRNGDVILSFDRQPIPEMRVLPRVVAETQIGTDVPVEILRDGKRQTVQVKVAQLQEAPPQKASDAAPAPKKPAPLQLTELSGLGLGLTPLNDASRKKFSLPADRSGAVVGQVAEGGPAAKAGLHPGDVIVEVQQENVSSPEDVQKRISAARAAKQPSVLVLVQGPGQDGMRWVPLGLGKVG